MLKPDQLDRPSAGTISTGKILKRRCVGMVSNYGTIVGAALAATSTAYLVNPESQTLFISATALCAANILSAYMYPSIPSQRFLKRENNVSMTLEDAEAQIGLYGKFVNSSAIASGVSCGLTSFMSMISFVHGTSKLDTMAATIPAAMAIGAGLLSVYSTSQLDALAPVSIWEKSKNKLGQLLAGGLKSHRQAGESLVKQEQQRAVSQKSVYRP